MENIADLLNEVSKNILPFIMVFTRLTAIFLIIPFFRGHRIPNIVKIISALALTIVIFPIIGIEMDIMTLSFFEIFNFIIIELVIGIMIGFFVDVAFSAIQGAGRIIDISSGFGFTSLLDPINNSSVTVTADFYGIIATSIFFMMGGHNFLINSIAKSYELLPLGKINFSVEAVEVLARSFSDIFLISLKIGAPIISVLFVTEIALAILARAIPQINVFMVGFPLKIAVALLIVSFTLINTVPYFQKVFSDSFININCFIRSMAKLS